MQSDEARPRVLNPVDRVMEIIFGLLMAMTFVGALSVATSGREEARTMLIAALGCNLAWGLADAVMYMVRAWTERTRNRNLLVRLQQSVEASEGQALVADALPPYIAAATGAEGLEMLRRQLLEFPEKPAPSWLSLDVAKGALGIFLLVVLSTFPLVIPFLLIDRTALAIRVSNWVALTLLFICGWILARYSGGNPWAGGAAIALVGTLLLFAIIALGG
jgi:VIT1/CCC1 family predicted Fe2+/Mn2+ transporter